MNARNNFHTADLSHEPHIISGVVIIHESDYELVKRYGWRQCPVPHGSLVDGFITVSRDDPSSPRKE